MVKILIQFVALLLCATSVVIADVPAEQVKEVEHLLKFIKNSGCVINRNGTDHLAEKGLKHIKDKYDYFRDDIKSTEDFIVLSATKSTMSGEYYKVKCSGEKMIKTQDWLLSELKKYRDNI